MTETTTSELEATAQALGAAGYAAYSLTLVGHAAPIANSYRERVMNPQEGDLVVETSTVYFDRPSTVGWLVEHKVERLQYDELNGSEWYDEEAWYVRPFVGGEAVRWTNADFIAIPATVAQIREWQGR